MASRAKFFQKLNQLLPCEGEVGRGLSAGVTLNTISSSGSADVIVGNCLNGVRVGGAGLAVFMSKVRHDHNAQDEGSGITFVKLNGGKSVVLLKEGEANRIILADRAANDIQYSIELERNAA